MPKIKTSELTGPALNWAVATALGRAPKLGMESHGRIWRGWWLGQGGEYEPMPDYCDDWAQGGPIIEREFIELHTYSANDDGVVTWRANDYMDGPTPLIAAMRCFVTSKFGDEIDVPEELI